MLEQAAELPYHVTQRGTNREKVFFSVADRHLYLQLIRENLAEPEMKVLAYCLMTNHVHFVVVPQREDSLARLFGCSAAPTDGMRRRQTFARGAAGIFGRPASSLVPFPNSAYGPLCST